MSLPTSFALGSGSRGDNQSRGGYSNYRGRGRGGPMRPQSNMRRPLSNTHPYASHPPPPHVQSSRQQNNNVNSHSNHYNSSSAMGMQQMPLGQAHMTSRNSPHQPHGNGYRHHHMNQQNNQFNSGNHITHGNFKSNDHNGNYNNGSHSNQHSHSRSGRGGYQNSNGRGRRGGGGNKHHNNTSRNHNHHSNNSLNVQNSNASPQGFYSPRFTENPWAHLEKNSAAVASAVP